MSDVLVINLVAALLIWMAGFAVFGRFIAPRWKVWGKLAFFLLVTGALSLWLGLWALVWVVGHQGLGLLGHAWWCGKHGIDWLTCQPRDRYLELRPWAAADGFGEAP